MANRTHLQRLEAEITNQKRPNSFDRPPPRAAGADYGKAIVKNSYVISAYLYRGVPAQQMRLLNLTDDG